MAHSSIESAKTHCKQGHIYDEANTYFAKTQRVCRTCSRDRVKAKRKILVQELVKLKLEKGCAKCGYNKCGDVLGFHHPDPSIKVEQVPNMFSYSKKRREAEIAKCVLLCANCHLEEHARLRKNIG